MEKELFIATDAPYTLNFMLYIQNIFINQNQSTEQHKYPFIASKIDLNKNFISEYKDLWNQMIERLSNPQCNEMEIFYEEKNLFYERLFVMNADSLKTYNDIHTAFEVWWGSFAGRFSIERSIDEPLDKLYRELAKLLNQNNVKIQSQLKISLIYEECLLANEEVSPYFAVIPIRDFFVNYKDLAPKLQGCFY